MNIETDFSRINTMDDAEMFAQRRAAIDLVATTRAGAIRVALFGAYLFRNHPTRPEDETTRENWRETLHAQAAEIARTCQILNGSDPLGVFPAAITHWLNTYASTRPQQRDGFERMRTLTDAVVHGAHTADNVALESALKAHLTFGRGGFFDLVTDFCDGLWAQLDAERHTEIEQATAAGCAITNTLKRLEHIGKHVRLVSLNASVEAARVGDAGRGLGVIAVEFKTLAEEIQHLATTARSEISALAHQKT